MLGIDRSAARYTWTASLVLLLLCLIYQLRTTLFIFTLALLFAYLLSPLVNLLDRVLPVSRTRTPALALAYVLFVGAVVVAGAQIGSRVAEQANALIKKLPDMIASWQMPIPRAAPQINSLKQQIVDKLRAQVSLQSGDLISKLPQAGLKFLSVASGLVYIVIIPILSFFFLKDAREMREHLVELAAPGPRRELLDDVVADIHRLLAHYMRALVLLSIAAFTAFSIFFSIMGVPYGFLLAAVAGLLEFIPMLGPLTAGVIILIVAGVAGANLATILIFLIVYRVIQDYGISPHLMGQGVQLHSLLVLFGVFAGAEIAGVGGSFLSVPVLALIRIVYLRIRRARLGSQVSPIS